MLIAGPTASGKTALAIKLAKKLNAWIVNADSMQIYRDLRILSARPSKAEEAEASHVMFGHVASDQPYSVMTWLDEFGAVLAQARAEKRPLVVVGGTGLYFKSALEGLSLLPEISEVVREKWRRAASEHPSVELHVALQELDPVMAERLNPTDTQRIVRALEVIEGTGQSLSYWQQERSEPLLQESEVLRVVLQPDRRVLHERINQRFDMMVEAGAIEEATALREKRLSPDLQVMKAIGVKLLAEAERGVTSLDWAVERAKTETRRYAKRQGTFFRGQLSSWPTLDPLDPEAMEKFTKCVYAAFAKG